jgi:hypothetical protein
VCLRQNDDVQNAFDVNRSYRTVQCKQPYASLERAVQSKPGEGESLNIPRFDIFFPEGGVGLDPSVDAYLR